MASKPRPKGDAYFKRAEKVLVGGVNSPVRAFRSVGGTPVIVAKGQGARFWDLDGNAYIDYVLSWGPLILGHAQPKVLKAIGDAAKHGTSFGACHPLEAELAEHVRDAYPSCEKLRFVSSGTEATLSALRLARGATSRPFILKFEGCYHGHGDSLLVKAGSGAATMGAPDSRGVTEQTARQTLTVPYNDTAAVLAQFKKHGRQIAAIIVEPVVGNMGFVRPHPTFLYDLRKVCDQHGTLLIFDEVMTGFRVAYGGAQARFNIKPDLTCLGKVIGGGLPAAALGGRRDLMDQLAPLGGVYQAGTLSGNPLAMAAGLATLKQISRPGFYRGLEQALDQLLQGWQRLFDQAGVPAQVDGLGSMFGVFFNPKPVRNFQEASASDTAFFKKYFHGMLQEGVYLAPSAYEAGFLSAAHTPALIRQTHKAAERIEEGAPIPARLEAIFQDGTALGGARPKASVRNEQGVMCLAKFHSRTDTYNVPLIETATLQLAKEAGMEVPPQQYVTIGSSPAMLIRRFDRYWAPRGAKANAHLPDNLMETLPADDLVEKRLPFVSGLTLLACDEIASPTKSYGELAEAIRRYCHPKVIRKDNEELFRRMIYNIWVSNDDDHLRNHGFVWDARLPGWRLSPLYDVLPRASLAHERQLHLGIGPDGRAATLDNAFAARELFTLSPARAAALMAQVWEKVREWRVTFEQHGVTAEAMTQVAPAMRHIDDVSSAALRRQLP